MVTVQQIDSHLKNIISDLVHNQIKIYGRDHQVLAALLTIFSALELNFDGKQIRGWCDTLLFGESQTGKSETAKALIKLIGRGGYISGEGLSHVGLQGGIDKIGNSNVIRPGIFSIHDGEIVVIDELQGMTKEEFGKLSDVRMSGIARIQKIKSFRAPARCRKIWTANPRPLENGSITVKFSSEIYPINLVRKLIVTYEDMTRFDIIVGYKQSEFSLRKNARTSTTYKCKFTPKIMSKMVNHIWSRKSTDYEYLPETVDACFNLSEDMIKNFTSDFPMVLGAGQPDKLARLAAAAAGLFNLSSGENVDDFNKIIIRPEHVEWVVSWLKSVFKDDDLKYGEYAKACSSKKRAGEKNRQGIYKYLTAKSQYSKIIFVLSINSHITEYVLRTQIVSIPSPTELLAWLIQAGLLIPVQNGYRKTELLNDMLLNEFKNEIGAIEIKDTPSDNQNSKIGV